jgi:aconitate hydratase
VAGPKRPQDRIELPSCKDKFIERLQQAGHRQRLRQDGRGRSARRPVEVDGDRSIGHGSVLIAAITQLHQHLQPERACSPPACWPRRPCEKGLKREALA